MYCKLLVVSAVAVAAFFVTVRAQTTAAVTTPSPDDLCKQFSNTSCADCLAHFGSNTSSLPENFGCYWCGGTKTCSQFTVTTAIPIRGLSCPANRYNVGTCLLDVLIIIILIAVVCIIMLLMVCCCCCCCCIACANRRRRLKVLEENNYLDEKDSIRQKSSDRRQERKAKHDEIRRKYGLNNEEPGEGNYKRLS